MSPEHKAGQKRKRVPYEGRKSTRKPIKFKKQENYHSSSSEDDEEPIPAWRNNREVETIATVNAEGLDKHLSGDDAGGLLPNLVQEEQIADHTKLVEVRDNKPITFADLVKPAEVLEVQVGNKEDNDAPSIEYFDPSAPIHLSDDASSDAESEASSDASGKLEATGSSNSEVDEYEIDSDDATTTNASTTTRAIRKRNDPTAFAASISAILGSKLTTSKRADPILARSVSAATAAKDLADDKLEAKAKRKLRADKHALMEKGRVKDVLGLGRDNEATAEDISTGAIVEKEMQLRKTAQRGVVKLFNAVRAAQMMGFEAEEQARKEGRIGIDGKKERVTEMSKRGFLDLLAGGGGSGAA